MKKQRLYHFLFSFILVTLGVLLDQYTKHLAVQRLKDNAPFVLIKNVFQLEYLENRGAAFGILQGQQILFILCVLLITLFSFYFFIKVSLNRRFIPLRLCMILILAGAFGNCIDRIRLNYVVDFFYFKLINFPIFNVADIYVTVAAGLLIILLIFYYKEDDLANLFRRS